MKRSEISAAWRPAGAALAVLAVVLVYARTLTPDFFFFGDSWLALEHAAFSGFSDWLVPWPRTVYNDRPAGYLLVKLLYHAFRLDPVPYHAVLLGLHLANMFLVFSLSTRISGSVVLGWAAAMLFGLHHAASVTVPWIGAAFEVLCCLFCLLAFRLHISPGRWLRWAALACYFLAMRSKETALLLPVVLVFYELWVVNDGPSRAALAGTWKKTAPMLALMTAFGLWYLVLTLSPESRLPEAHPYRPDVSWSAFADGLGYYLGRIIYWNHAPIWLALLFGAGLATAVGRRAGTVVFGGLGFLLFLLPVLFIKDRRMDFYLYLPSVFFFIALLAAVHQPAAWLERRTGRPVLSLPLTRAEALTVFLALVLVGLPIWTGGIIERQARVSLFGRVNRHDLDFMRRRFPDPPPATTWYVSGVAFKGSVFAFRRGVALRVVYRDPDLKTVIGPGPERLAALYRADPGPKVLMRYHWRAISGRMPELTVLAGPERLEPGGK